MMSCPPCRVRDPCCCVERSERTCEANGQQVCVVAKEIVSPLPALWNSATKENQNLLQSSVLRVFDSLSKV